MCSVYCASFCSSAQALLCRIGATLASSRQVGAAEQEAFSVASESEGIKWLQCRQAVVRRAEESRFEFRQLSQHSTLLLSYLLLVLFGPPAGSKNAEQGECSDWTVRAQSQGP